MPSLREEILKRCPFKPTFIDECSGIEVPSTRYNDWIAGAVGGCEALLAVAKWHVDYLQEVDVGQGEGRPITENP